MPDTMSLNVRISGSLKDYVTEAVSTGAYENISEYVRDLIRREKERAEEQAFQTLKAELQTAFAAPESHYKPISQADIREQANATPA